MINSRKAIWADNLHCARVLQAALFRVCTAMAVEINIVRS